MKKSFKTFVLVSMSAMTLAGIAPVKSIVAQEATETSMEAISIDDIAEEEVQPNQKALLALVEDFKTAFPEATIERIFVEPLTEEEKTLAESQEQVLTEETTSEITMLEESEETMEAAEDTEDTEEILPFKVTIEALDAQTDQTVSETYNLMTGEIVPEEVSDEAAIIEGEEEVSDEATIVEGEEVSEESLEETGLEETAIAFEELEEESEVVELDLTNLAQFDEIKKEAEEKATFGEALEFDYSVNPETKVVEVAVTVYEDIEDPIEKPMVTITFDAEKLEVIKIEGNEAGEEAAGVTAEGNDAALGNVGSQKPTESGKPETDGENDDSQEDDAEETGEESDDNSEEGSLEETEEESVEETQEGSEEADDDTADDGKPAEEESENQETETTVAQ